MLKRFILKHPFWSFYCIAVAFPSLLMVYVGVLETLGQEGYSFFGHYQTLKQELHQRFPVLFHHQDSWVLSVAITTIVPLGLPMLLFPGAPTVSALLVTSLARGKQAVLALLKLYLPIQGTLTAREGIRIYAALIAGITFMVVATCLREYFWGDPDRVSGYLRHLGVIQWDIFFGTWFMAMLFNQGAALEELGWRGYALPLLIRKMGSPLGATMVLGVLWALWHFPREIPPLLQGSQAFTELLFSQGWFILGCVSMSVVATYFVNITGGSVLPAIIIHGCLNLINGMFNTDFVGMRSEITTEAPLMWMTAALVILVLAGRDLGWRRRQELLGLEDPADTWIDQPARI
ncbi:CPBP family intramembrane metalloprotease [Pseudomaricurvus alkylphenolicus]|uniref:CPBP family intramembrane glutamic endopeptidase n=1 Tax=Pseudomaricurvus alkylphenolicus TaxID=1306991 RepID=UPI001422C8EF|nr:CPBP family intramembrane glutamic endopeptidase [Pseudomaricurvus alkylphenolicus]NIB42496.1 CPBP family intramembrane metalloprotease [Pseudomaricurvus alkylphenolicus]